MLRNLATLTSNGLGICGTNLVGVPASEIPTGFVVPGLLNNDIAQGDPANCLYRVEIISWPSSGKLEVDENGAFSFTGAPDGLYTGATKVYKNNASDSGSYSFTIGTDQTSPDVTINNDTLSIRGRKVAVNGTVNFKNGNVGTLIALFKDLNGTSDIGPFVITVNGNNWSFASDPVLPPGKWQLQISAVVGNINTQVNSPSVLKVLGLSGTVTLR